MGRETATHKTVSTKNCKKGSRRTEEEEKRARGQLSLARFLFSMEQYLLLEKTRVFKYNLFVKVYLVDIHNIKKFLYRGEAML